MLMVSEQISNLALLRLFQLVSPALPVGAYAYSQGLEYAVDQKWLTDESQTQAWLLGLLQNNLAYLDVPIFKRLYSAWQANEMDQVKYWNHYLLASREARELQFEDQHLGNALLRLLRQLEPELTQHCINIKPICFAAMFSFAAVAWSIPLREAVMGYLWAWLENQVAAAVKLVPLGQTAGQRILRVGMTVIPVAMEKGLDLQDDAIGFMAPSLVMACAAHEEQYSRLFQS